ncbi:unnamed protein product [Timema podura]|uniref:C2H2-type domain-containing protein n=1 Tax=Timema podura TaxID=61482 RepID=A0ABN7NS83_TIMPD|nr:unnamed protein product [Timema podura]
MHANYHRKDSAIIQEGFQRFRATEECGAAYCSFYGQRTTHFHCRRDNCKYTFKNKADMEKHKTYHIKDEQLSRDGFKKFMKHESCPFENCRFSRVCNHIHCIRTGCNYVLHSSGQLFSHKRKHERQDSEMAYRKFKLAQSMIKTFNDGPQLSSSMVHAYNEQLSQHSDTSVSSIQTSVIQQCPGGVGISESRDNYSNGENSSDEGHSPMLQNTQLHSTFPTKYLPLEAGSTLIIPYYRSQNTPPIFPRNRLREGIVSLLHKMSFPSSMVTLSLAQLGRCWKVWTYSFNQHYKKF